MGELSQGFDRKVTIAQVDVDQSQDLANLFGIRSIPTMVIFKDGNKLVQTMRRQAEQFGTEMTFGFVQKLEELLDEHQNYQGVIPGLKKASW